MSAWDLSLNGTAGVTAKRCRASITDRDDEHRQYDCELMADHIGPHKDGDCEWSDGSHYWGQEAATSEGDSA